MTSTFIMGLVAFIFYLNARQAWKEVERLEGLLKDTRKGRALLQKAFTNISTAVNNGPEVCEICAIQTTHIVHTTTPAPRDQFDEEGGYIVDHNYVPISLVSTPGTVGDTGYAPRPDTQTNDPTGQD